MNHVDIGPGGVVPLTVILVRCILYVGAVWSCHPMTVDLPIPLELPLRTCWAKGLITFGTWALHTSDRVVRTLSSPRTPA